ncbi:MAG TPA: 30S ribosomal protein S6 [Rhabdochlamydiaceae bacterium]|nr:30S ribosomal protein S6 [Rhabdochlamydiaceae bacterium]
MAKKERRHLYEGMYILSATLSEEARKKALDKITSSISSKKGEIDRVFEQGRRKMAYEINGRREGYYYIIYFSAPTSIVADLWKEYHLNEDLIRFVTMRAETVPENMEFKPLVIEKA